MKHRRAGTTLLMLAPLLLTACGEPEDTRPGKPVAHRQAAFKEILDVFEPMGALLKKEPLDTRTFQALSKQLLTKREAPWQYFGPDTNYPPSHSKPEVWSQRDKFETEKKAFFDATNKLDAAISTGADRSSLETTYEAVHNACKSCHKGFKNRG